MAKGWHHTEEWKRNKSKQVKDYFRTHKHPRIGMKHSKKSKKKMSNTRKGKVGFLHPQFKGRYLDKGSGYITIQLGKKQEREHRYIMMQHLGRPLKFHEIVHHINGNRTDNRIENMIIVSRSDHMKIHKISPWK